MKFTNILKSIILENSRFKVLYDSLVQQPSPEGKFKPDPKKIPFETLKALIFADPTTIVPRGAEFDVDTAAVADMEKVKVGKYTNWLIKNFMKPVNIEANPEDPRAYAQALKSYQNLFMEDLYKVTGDLKKYERFKNTFPQEKRDIAKLSKEDVYQLTKDLSLDKTKASKAEKEEAKKSYEHPGSTVVFRGSTWTVIKIEGTSELQKDAACFYGGYHQPEKGESRWCTSYTLEGSEWWKRYLSKGPLYVILPNESSEVGQMTGLPVERYQFHFPDQQFMDRHDVQQNLVDLLNGKLKELKDYFKPEFAKGLVSKGEKKVNIQIPEGAAGKFIALYGAEEIFDNLPDDIVSMIIENKKTNATIKIPPSISRFQNLETLMLDNVIDSLPDEVSYCKSLNFLSLPNNKSLKSLPDSIGTMDNLSFVNISGCDPSLRIPDSIADKFDDIGNGLYFKKD